MPGKKLITACRQVLDGLTSQVRMEAAGDDPSGEKSDAIAADMRPTIAFIVQTQAATLAECGAKAELYIVLDREDLAASLARDVVSLASVKVSMQEAA